MDKDFNNMPPFMDFSAFQQMNGFNSTGNPDMNDLIKCKEYEKMCSNNSSNSNERTQRRVE